MSKRRSPSNSAPASLAADGDRQRLLHVGDVQAEARSLGAVDLHRQHRQAGGLLDLHVGRAGDGFQHLGDLARPSRSSTSMSSPNTFTATSLRTPEISSLKRIWIGWVNS